MILILAEKPKAAFKIASILSRGKLSVKKEGPVKYFEFFRGNSKIVCVPSLGHLFKLDVKNRKKWYYPVFKVEWMPTYKEVGKRKLNFYLKVLEKLGKKASDIIIATDYDIEGDVIGYNILRFVFKRSNAKRMKFSSLTKEEIENAFKNLMPSLDFGQVFAGLTRHYLDFYWGVNLTRALSLCARYFVKKKVVISVGRVQSPTLYLVFKREKEIEKFVPKVFWTIKAELEKNGKKFVANYEGGRIFDESAMFKILNECRKENRGKVVSKRVEKIKILRPVPFDLTTLQREAYKYFKISPSKTLKIAEDLYLEGLISYPRTSSQKLPKTLNVRVILAKLRKFSEYSSIANELLDKGFDIRNGRKDDPAHPAIYPTGNLPKKLKNDEKKIYDLIVRRFLACMYKDATKVRSVVRIKIGKYTFVAESQKIERKGWLKVYKFAHVEESEIPDLEEGEEVNVVRVVPKKDKTKPPPHYNQGELVAEMEKRKLGTKGTRSRIIDILYKRGYIRGKSKILITELGERLVNTLEKFVQEILSEKLTRHFEEEMEKVMKKEKRMDDVLREAKIVLIKILTEIKRNEYNIGKYLQKGLS